MSDYPDQSGFNGPVDQAPPPQQQQPEKPKEDFCKRLFTNRGCKCFIIASVFVIAPILIGIVGIMCPIFLIAFKVQNPVPPFIFCIYCLIFGIMLLLVEFRIKLFGNIFVFLLSYFYKAIFIIFLGTLTMGAFEDIAKWSWIGYVSGVLIILIGILHIIVGCCDRAWADTQQKKMDATAQSYGWDAAPSLPNKSDFSGTTPQQQQQSQYPQQQYPPSGYNNQGYNNQGYNNQGYTNKPQSQQGYASGVAAAATMPETQQFVSQAGSTAARAYIGGASRNEALTASMYDPNVQQAAGQAIIAGAQNEQVRGAAIAGASNAASTGFGYAYDSMFD